MGISRLAQVAGKGTLETKKDDKKNPKDLKDPKDSKDSTDPKVPKVDLQATSQRSTIPETSELSAVVSNAATVVSNNVSGTWTANESPYILSASCAIVSNQTLTIEPGVEVKAAKLAFVSEAGLAYE